MMIVGYEAAFRILLGFRSGIMVLFRGGKCAVLAVVLLIITAASSSPSDRTSVPLAYWSEKLRPAHPVELNPVLNGTADGGVPYSTRLANMANYSSVSEPVRGIYPKGYGTVISQLGPAVYFVGGRQNVVPQSVSLVSAAGADLPNGSAAGLQSLLLSVPIPSGARGRSFEQEYGRSLAAPGPDGHVVIYDEVTRQMWEFWQFRYSESRDRYEAGFAGYVPDVSAAPPALPNGWGARATGIPLVMGVMLQSEVKRMRFAHPIALAIPVVKDGFIPPAVRQDESLARNSVGSDGRDEVPEGAWFRLPSTFTPDVNEDPLLKAVMLAARDYGLVVVDGSGGTVSMFVESPESVGTPFSIMSSSPLQVDAFQSKLGGSGNILTRFPWDSLVQISPRV